MDVPTQHPTEFTPPKHSLIKLHRLLALIRDAGVILGFPLLVTIGVKLYDLQTKSIESQVKANEAQIKVVEAQNNLLRETQYDHALSLLKSQKDLFEIERSSLERQIVDLKSRGNINTDISTRLTQQADSVDKKLDALDTAISVISCVSSAEKATLTTTAQTQIRCDPLCVDAIANYEPITGKPVATVYGIKASAITINESVDDFLKRLNIAQRFAKFTLPNQRGAVWISGPSVKSVRSPVPGEYASGVNGVIRTGSLVQGVKESPKEALVVLNAHGARL